MTTPHQNPDDAFGNVPDLAALIGQGAFRIGNAPQNWGQGITEDFVRVLTMGPAALVTTAFNNIGEFFSALQDFLTQLPLEALQMFRRYIPDALEEDFQTIAGAVTKIMQFFTAATGLVKFDDLQNWISDVYHILETEFHQVLDLFNNLIVTPITQRVASFQDWLNGLKRFQTGLLDSLWTGFSQITGIGKSSADVGNAAADTATKAAEAASIGELNSAILATRNNKSIFQGIDETEESNFSLDAMMGSGGTDPVHVISATASNVPVAYWRAGEAAKKGFISWFGKGFDNITGLYLDIYKANYATSTWDPIHTSPNVIGPVASTWKYLAYSITDELQRLDIQQSDVIGVGWRVVGTGTHYIGGISAGSWMTDHPIAQHPKRPASTRTGSGPLAFTSTTYSNDTPWFGIGIITGDIVPPALTPRTQTIATPGAFTYTIPEQFRVQGCVIDVILLGDGGGGSAFSGAPGGACGEWTAVSLVYGVDIPLGTETLSGTIGSGGAGGSVISGIPNGTSGSGTQVVVPGYGTITAAGGAAAGAPGFFGEGVTPLTYQGVIYQGGGEATVPGEDGQSPGGGGGSWSIGGAAGKGGIGWAKFIARQA